MKKVYISIPISGRDIYAQRRIANDVAERFRRVGYEAITPFDIIPIGDPAAKDYATCMGRDIDALLRCDIIAMVDDWENSKGCRAEKAVAEVYGIDVRFVAF